ncbi:MAG: PaaI family thioesterase [Planctomycetota bacterium]|nr:MAG: PaaI family thioesterase [Planctomycetota bacterium]
MPGPPAAIDAATFDRLLREHVPMAKGFGCETLEITRGRARLRLPFDPKLIRPGDTVSGPAIFTLADTALYAAVLSHTGLEPLAVTADMQLRFLRSAGRHTLLAEARLLKTGARLAVGEVRVWREGEEPDRLVALATGAYAIPSGASTP